MYKKSYDEFPDSKGLYYLIDPVSLKIRDQIIKTWKDQVVEDAYFFKGSNLVPSEVLKKSGHLDQFGDQIFKVSTNLCLRPETAQSLFPNLKNIRRQLKGNPLKIYQIGDSYRNEKTTRGGHLRKRQFEQLELHVLAEKNYSFFQNYKPKLDSFFKKLGLDPTYVLLDCDKPHYSAKTWDLYIESTEVGCINYRGSHDLYTFTPKQNETQELFEISLGVDRLIHYILQNNKNLS